MYNYHPKNSDNAEVISIFTKILPTPLFCITNVVTYTVTNISPFQKPFVKKVRSYEAFCIQPYFTLFVVHLQGYSKYLKLQKLILHQGPIKLSQMAHGMTKHTQINSQEALKMAKNAINYHLNT